MKTPLYKQIMDDMIDKIGKQNLKPHDSLESESELEKLYGVSNITVRKALNELDHDGVIYRIKGKGSFVASSCTQTPGGVGLSSVRVITFVVGDQQNTGCMNAVAGASACVQQMKGYLLNIISASASQLNSNELLEQIYNSGSSGLLFWPNDNGDCVPELSILSSRRFPVVTLDQNLHLERVDSVLPDNVKGTYDAVSLIIGEGHRRIGFLSNVPMQRVNSVRERYLGYCQALVDHNIPVNPDECFNDFEAISKECMPEHPNMFSGSVWPSQPELREFYKRLLDKMLNRQEPVTAVQCVNDLIAVEFMTNAIALGVKVPRELSVAGFDDLNICEYVEPQLTTVRQDMHSMGYSAVQLLVKRIENNMRQSEALLLPVKVIKRQSVVSAEINNEIKNPDTARCMDA